MNTAQKNMRAEGGFTLVELAIVMIIIGLLIAGVLKGQALITNARITSTVAQVKAIEAATSTFRDTYNFNTRRHDKPERSLAELCCCALQ